MEQMKYDFDKLSNFIKENIDKGLIVETNANVLKIEDGVTFNLDEKNKLFHNFKFKGGIVYLFYVKKLLDKNGNILLENNFCNLNYSVYDIFLNVFGEDVAKRYAMWREKTDNQMPNER